MNSCPEPTVRDVASPVGATETIAVLGLTVTIVEAPEAVSTGCTGLRIWGCALDFSTYLVDRAEKLGLKGSTIVELGCGCALVGFTAALLGGHVILTDRNHDCLELVRASAAANSSKVAAASGSVRTVHLDWTWFQGLEGVPYGTTDFVLGSELIYDKDCAQKLPSVIAALLSPKGRFIALLGVRDVSMLDAFITSAYTVGLELVNEPQTLTPSRDALQRAADCIYDAEVTSSTHRWSGYILVEMQKCSA